VAVAFIKGKVVLTGIAFKQVTQRVVDYDVATWLKPYSGTMLACVLWDGLMCHAIIKNATIRAVGVTTAVEVFNEIVDLFCPRYEESPPTLSEAARVQFLRAVGVAIVKHGSMFPTMELLLRHAISYFDMKKAKAVTGGGVLDDEAAFIRDFDQLSLDESRAVLCTHMLCYVLDGSVGFAELALWRRLLQRVEELYQREREGFDALPPAALRRFIAGRMPCLADALARIPADGAAVEAAALRQLAQAVPRPERATSFDQLVPRVVCQRFRRNIPVDAAMLCACFDPEAHKTFMARALSPPEIFRFTFNELAFKAMSILTKQV
jgi:hypothetical protein